MGDCGASPCRPCGAPPLDCGPEASPACECAPPPCSGLKYLQPPVTKSYRPKRVYQPPCIPIDDTTIYKLSFFPNKPAREPMIIHRNNLTIGGNFYDDTTNKHDYRNWPGACRSSIICPKRRKLLGDGQMSDLTTQKHDYVAKVSKLRTNIKPRHNLGFSQCPFSEITTANASYMMPENPELPKSYRPKRIYEKPCVPFDSDTVMNLSYVPWPTCNKGKISYAPKHEYLGPVTAMDCCTVYSSSYHPPGKFTCDGGAPACPPPDGVCLNSPPCAIKDPCPRAAC